MQQIINDLRSMMAWFRKKLFYKMSEKNLPLDPNVLEPTLFGQTLSEEEQARLDAEVKAMEERNAKAIEVKAHKRDVLRPVAALPWKRRTSIPRASRTIPITWRSA